MSPRLSARLRHYLPAALWALFVGAVLLAPSSTFEEAAGRWYELLLDLPWADKLTHVLLFAIMAWLVHRSMAAAGASNPTLKAFVASAAYGLLLDLLQYLTPSRTTDLLDILANTFGAAAGAWLATRRFRSAR